MQKTIFRGVFVSLLVSCVLVSALLAWAIYGDTGESAFADLKKRASALASELDAGGGEKACATAAAYADMRVTWIDAQGNVRYDSETPAADMENHADREEVALALETGEGSASRDSETLDEQYDYYALRLADGGVARLSQARRNALGLLLDMRPAFALVLTLALVMALIVSWYLARAVVRPLNALDLDRPEANAAYDEIKPLLMRIAQQKSELSGQLREIQLRGRQLSEITENMREGLILTDRCCRVLTVNASAERLLAGELPEEAYLRALCQNGPPEKLLPHHGRTLEMHVSPVVSDEETRGYVLLLMDVTQKRDAEALRREFSANVSHELKTPLTSISGYAEIMKNGLVKGEDVPNFAGRIYDEAQRLIALIGDIIRLSKLDEGDVRAAKEDVELRSLCDGIAASLAQAAENADVRLTVEGEASHVRAVRQLVSEMIANLADNAIRYNVPGGEVRVRVEGRRVTVSDTGIGIAPEHQDKVFERFYRVDKSHSRATGGTGLGLSIVKHAAAFHGAKLSLQSEPGKGTSISVEFP